MWHSLRSRLVAHAGLDGASGPLAGPMVPMTPGASPPPRVAHPPASVTPVATPAPSPVSDVDAVHHPTAQQVAAQGEALIVAHRDVQARLRQPSGQGNRPLAAADVHTSSDFQRFCRQLSADKVLDPNDTAKLVAARKQVLAESKNRDYDAERTLGILNSAVSSQATPAIKRTYNSVTGELDARLATPYRYTDAECHGHPEHYAHNLAVEFQAVQGRPPKSVDDLVSIMRAHLPPLSAAVLMPRALGQEPDHTFNATSAGKGFCDNLSEYVVKTFQVAGENLGFGAEVERRVAKISCSLGDTDKHFSVAVGAAVPAGRTTHDHPRAMVIDLWMGRNALPPTLDMRVWLNTHDDSQRPEAFGSRAAWEGSCRQIWGGEAEFSHVTR